MKTLAWFAVESLAAQGSVVAVLQRRSWADVDGFDADAYQPVLHRLRDKFGTVVGTDVLGGPVAHEQRIQRLQDSASAHPGANPCRSLRSVSFNSILRSSLSMSSFECRFPSHHNSPTLSAD